MSEREGIVSVDLGTTNVKVSLFTTDGSLVYEGSTGYPISKPRPGWFEHDPRDWFTAALSLLREAVREAERRGVELLGLVSTGQREGLVPASRSGEPLRPCITWMDRRSSREAAEVASLLGRRELYVRTGLVAEPTYTLTKILWLKRNEPSVYERSWKLLQPKEYLNYLLTGRAVTDPSLASRTMAYDVRRGEWIHELLEELSVDFDKLPEVAPSDEVVGCLREELKRELGLNRDLPVVNGGGDRPCEALGAGVLTPERVGEGTGTTTNVATTVGEPVLDEAMRVLLSRHVLRERWLLEAGTAPTGAALSWLIENCFRDLIEAKGREGTFKRVDVEVAARLGRRPNLITLPHFLGSRAPYWREGARGAVLGLTLHHDRYDLVRSLMEGMAFVVRDVVDAFKSLEVGVEGLVSYGGLAGSRAWALIKASVLGVPVRVLRRRQPSASGAAILAGLGLGVYSSLSDVPRSFFEVEWECWPNEALAEGYRKLYEAYRVLNEGVTELIEEVGDRL